MSAGSTVDLVSSAVGATVLASVGFFAQSAGPPADSLSVVGGLAQIGSAGLVLYTVRMFLQDRKETEKDMGREREAAREHFDTLVEKVEGMHQEALKTAERIKDENREALKDIAKEFHRVVDRMEHLHMATKCGVPSNFLPETIPVQSGKTATTKKEIRP